MSSEVNEAIISRIRKLMAYANDGSASEGEIENALGHARRLMDKHALSEADIVADPDQPSAARKAAYESIITMVAYDRSGNIDHYDLRLAAVADYICDVKHYRSKGLKPGRECLIYYGLPRDCEVAKALYLELLATMRAMSKFRTGGYDKSYCMGFVERLCQRASELKRTAPAEAGTTAIVLVKDQLVKRWAEENLSLTKGRSRSVRSLDGEKYIMGQADGSRVSLGHDQLPGTKPPTAGRKELN